MDKTAKEIAEFLGVKVSDVKISDVEFAVGDEVLAEIQKGVMVRAFIDEIHEGIAYMSGDDGEPYCAPLTMLSKVPY